MKLRLRETLNEPGEKTPKPPQTTFYRLFNPLIYLYIFYFSSVDRFLSPYNNSHLLINE